LHQGHETVLQYVTECKLRCVVGITQVKHAARADLAHPAEYGPDTYPSPREAVRFNQFPWGLQPPHEALVLSDYRQRYATYRTDEGLQARALQFCCGPKAQKIKGCSACVANAA
jgi:hypothetical protein